MLLKPAGKGLRMEMELKEHLEPAPSLGNLKFALAGPQNLQVGFNDYFTNLFVLICLYELLGANLHATADSAAHHRTAGRCTAEGVCTAAEHHQ